MEAKDKRLTLRDVADTVEALSDAVEAVSHSTRHETGRCIICNKIDFVLNMQAMGYLKYYLLRYGYPTLGSGLKEVHFHKACLEKEGFVYSAPKEEEWSKEPDQPRKKKLGWGL